MKLAEFIDLHAPALESDEVRHNLILGILARAQPDSFRFWTLGVPGECAIQSGGYPIVLGALSRRQSESLAELTKDMHYPGVVGTGKRLFGLRSAQKRLEFRFRKKSRKKSRL